MAPKWEHIKSEIQGKEAPLAADAWKNMDALLNANAPKKKAFYWWLIVPVLLSIAVGSVYFFHATTISNEPQTPISDEREAPIAQPILNDEKETPATPQAEPELVSSQKTEQSKTVDKTSGSALAAIPKTSDEINASKIESPLPTETQAELKILPADAKNEISEENQEIAIADSSSFIAEIQENTNDEFVSEEETTTLPPIEQFVNHKGIWELKAFAGPSYNMPNITYNSVENYSHRDYENATNNSVKAGWGFDAGLEISYFLTPHFKLSTGINYREIVTTNSMNYAVADIPVIDSASGQILGYITLPDATNYSSSSQNSFVYVGVPISLFKEIPLRGRFSLTAEFVNTFSFLIVQNSEDINPTTLQIEGANDDMFNPLLVNYQLRLGLRYRLKENFIFALEPAYRGTYNNMYKSDYISWKPKDFAINAAIIIQLRKK